MDIVHPDGIEPERPGQATRRIPIWRAFGKVIRGNHGEITISGGAIVAKIFPPDGSWSLQRHEDTGPDEPAQYVLRAVLSYVNPHFINNEALTKRMTVSMLRGQKLRLVLPDPRRMGVKGLSLLIDGVMIEDPQKE